MQCAIPTKTHYCKPGRLLLVHYTLHSPGLPLAMFHFFLPQTKIQRCKPGGWLLWHFAFTCWCACFCFLFFSPTNRDSKMQTRWVVALTLCIHLLVVPLETCLSFHPFCQLVSVGEVPVTKVQHHSHKGPLLKSGQPYILYLYLCICICVFLYGFVFVYLYFTGKRSVILTKAHYCKRPTLLCLPRSFLLQYTKQQTEELWMFSKRHRIKPIMFWTTK